MTQKIKQLHQVLNNEHLHICYAGKYDKKQIKFTFEMVSVVGIQNQLGISVNFVLSFQTFISNVFFCFFLAPTKKKTKLVNFS